MEKIILMMMIALIGGLTNQSVAQKKGNEIVCFKSNMDCANCEKTIGDYLRFEKGVKDLKIDHVSNTVLVEFKDGKNNAEGIAKAIEKKGYKASKITMEEYKKLTNNSVKANDEIKEK